MGKSTCSIDGCTRAARCRGWCGTHYERWRRTGSTDDPARQDGCSIGGCDRPFYGRSWCQFHYGRWYKLGDPLATARTEETLAQRLDRWAPPTGPDDCWPWTGHLDDGGYGEVAIGGGRTMRAHRAAWMVENGPIPDDVVIRHTCDNPPCRNPRHLVSGTQADNINDAIERQRWIHGQRHPRAKLTASQIVAIRTALGTGSTPTDLSRSYAVSITHICRIRDRQSRKHG